MEKYIYDNNNGLSKTQDWRKQSMGEHPAKSCVFLYGGGFFYSVQQIVTCHATNN